MIKLLKLALLTIALTALVGCASSDPIYPSGTASTAADEAMLETIQRAFWEDPMIDEDDLTITVDNGDVWVSGPVSTTQEKQRINDVLHAVDGIGYINLEGLDRQ